MSIDLRTILNSRQYTILKTPRSQGPFPQIDTATEIRRRSGRSDFCIPKGVLDPHTWYIVWINAQFNQHGPLAGLKRRNRGFQILGRLHFDALPAQ